MSSQHSKGLNNYPLTIKSGLIAGARTGDHLFNLNNKHSLSLPFQVVLDAEALAELEAFSDDDSSEEGIVN